MNFSVNISNFKNDTFTFIKDQKAISLLQLSLVSTSVVLLYLHENTSKSGLLMSTHNVCFHGELRELRKMSIFLVGGVSNEYPQHIFSRRNKKNIYIIMPLM